MELTSGGGGLFVSSRVVDGIFVMQSVLRKGIPGGRAARRGIDRGSMLSRRGCVCPNGSVLGMGLFESSVEEGNVPFGDGSQVEGDHAGQARDIVRVFLTTLKAVQGDEKGVGRPEEHISRMHTLVQRKKYIRVSQQKQDGSAGRSPLRPLPSPPRTRCRSPSSCRTRRSSTRPPLSSL